MATPAQGTFRSQVPILRMLADAPDGLTTADLRVICSPSDTRQRAQARMGASLRYLERRGYVVRTGGERRYAAGVAKRQPSCVWRITGDGRAATAAADDDAQARAVRVAVQVAEAGEALATLRKQALAAAAAMAAGPVSRRQRRGVAHSLRAAGCTLQEIGDVFGVTREMIRQDLLPDEPSANSDAA
jgi:hypothetical protein